MEDYKIEIRLGDGPKANTVTMEIEEFTLVGATTRLGMLTAPMRARFGIEQRLNFYPADDLELIVQRTADVLKVDRRSCGRDRDRPPRSRYTARRQPPAPPRPRLRSGARQRRGDEVDRRPGAVDARRRRVRSRRHGHANSPHDHREVRRRPGGAEHDRGRRSARTRTRSRKCTSRSSCSTDSCSVRRAGERRRERHTNTSGSWSRVDRRRSSKKRERPRGGFSRLASVADSEASPASSKSFSGSFEQECGNRRVKLE